MYCYVYDELLQDKRHEREVDLLETRLTDLGIMGKVVRLALFRDAAQVIRDEIRHGITTFVAVGTDQTFKKVLQATADTRVTVGYLPIGSSVQPMADLLGVPQGVAACDVLSARLVEEIDVGEVNGRRFLHSATMDGTGVTIFCEDSYTVTPLKRCSLELRNLTAPDAAGAVSPTDGRITLVLRHPKFSLFSRKETFSKIPLTKMRIFAQRQVTMLADGEKIIAQEFAVQALASRLRVIAGKGRKFEG